MHSDPATRRHVLRLQEILRTYTEGEWSEEDVWQLGFAFACMEAELVPSLRAVQTSCFRAPGFVNAKRFMQLHGDRVGSTASALEEVRHAGS